MKHSSCCVEIGDNGGRYIPGTYGRNCSVMKYAAMFGQCQDIDIIITITSQKVSKTINQEWKLNGKHFAGVVCWRMLVYVLQLMNLNDINHRRRTK